MHVQDLLQTGELDLALVWGGENLLHRTISGVTATDLEDPARFVQPGEVVLSGLVWWNAADGRGRAERFVAALARSGAAALLAGEETHGSVPADVVDACRSHGMALLSVPAHTNFRAITDVVYRRQWGELSRSPADAFALPENVRADLRRLVDRDTDAGELLHLALAPFGTPPAYVLTRTGRTIARTSSAPELPAERAVECLRGRDGETLRIPTESTPYDAWHLHVPDSGGTPPRALHEIAEVFGRYRHFHELRHAEQRRSGQELITLIERGDMGAAAYALESCGSLAEGPWRVVVAGPDGRDSGIGVEEALREALQHLPRTVFAAGTTSNAEAVAVVRANSESGLPLDKPWALLRSCRPEIPLYVGVSALAAEPVGLQAALDEARYALTAARHSAPPTGGVLLIEELDSLNSLMAGVPTGVRRLFGAKMLGPLADSGAESHRTLLETLEAFLAHNCSWARTAEALHVHVNTVHYRIERVQSLTGRDLTRLDHRLDLRAALMCSAPGPS
ncbi:helix-turn-helix domain-containing protein [Streptomyces sp. NPDC050658]|uniref:helix-turn-helix domain-containing protein n=1 Tax=unclassified Streptomyces TaxID=2593676 RepID=UPI00343C4CEC